MVESLTAIIGIGVTSFLLFYFSNQIGDSEQDVGRQILKLFSLSAGILLLLIIPSILMSNQYCEVVVSNSTIIGNNVTYYDYSYDCFDQQDTAGITVFYKIMLWFFRIFLIILLLRVCWVIIKIIMSWAKVKV